VTQRRRRTAGTDAGEQTMLDQEVLRATRELAAYFKGGRTEREARAALKIIKAFVRDRERIAPKDRRPLPHAKARTPAVAAAPRKTGAFKRKHAAKPISTEPPPTPKFPQPAIAP
jgi:hypothetical protein